MDADSILDSLGEWLRTFRKRRDYTQGQLADRFDVSRSYIAKVETGRINLSVTRFFEYLNALGYAVSLQCRPKNDGTRCDWGPVQTDDPEQRERVLEARRVAETVACFIYREFDVQAVFAFGSLVKHDGQFFREDSDIDLGVDGLGEPSSFDVLFTVYEEVDAVWRTPHEIDLQAVEDLPHSVLTIPTNYLPAHKLDEDLVFGDGQNPDG